MDKATGDLENPTENHCRGKPPQTRVAHDDASLTSTEQRNRHGLGLRLTVALILFLGAITSMAFLGVGISSAKKDQRDQFQRRSDDLVNQIQRSLEDYVHAASWIHGRCRSRNFTRQTFREMYEYIINSGLDFQAAQFDPNITHEERPAAEQEAREFYANYYPHIEYRGFVGFNYDNSTSLEPRNDSAFYFPIHYMEPVIGNEPAIDLDYHASGSRKRTVLFCMNEGLPALTDRLRLVQETTESAYGVVLMHPGYKLSTDSDETWPRDLASIVIRIPDLIRRAAKDLGESSAVYIYDGSDSTGEILFLGGATVEGITGEEARLSFLPELELDELRDIHALTYEETVDAVNKEWIVFVHNLEGTYEPNILFVVLGGVIIFVASCCLALWVYSNTKRIEQFNLMRSEADNERARLILDNAKKATKAERDLNDFIGHEVRNPVAAAMSACSFVKVAVSHPEPLRTQEQILETQQDVDIIDNALRFVNDLLRNMLDMHRAANKQLKINMTPTDILHDVLEPVQAMLPQRDTNFKVLVECPDGLVTMTDRLRLKQVCLNLARNSVKFVDEGFIRLKAEVVDGDVQISIEDSGPGIPKEKRDMLFAKFQESLDSLSQGTGIGLFLCKNLVGLMNGQILLDDDYESGVPGYPGSRFVIDLKQPAIDGDDIFHQYESQTGVAFAESSGDEEEGHLPDSLPKKLSVLFVDDDPILRKLFTRTVRTVAPEWLIREAANGETAMALAETEQFDLIFMDMYMASVEKQMLGTETVQALRSKGVKCKICGLSANDKESEFLEAGADVFTFKPFPCEARALTNELVRVLYTEKKPSAGD